MLNKKRILRKGKKATRKNGFEFTRTVISETKLPDQSRHIKIPDQYLSKNISARSLTTGQIDETPHVVSNSEYYISYTIIAVIVLPAAAFFTIILLSALRYACMKKKKRLTKRRSVVEAMPLLEISDSLENREEGNTESSYERKTNKISNMSYEYKETAYTESKSENSAANQTESNSKETANYSWIFNPYEFQCFQNVEPLSCANNSYVSACSKEEECFFRHDWMGDNSQLVGIRSLPLLYSELERDYHHDFLFIKQSEASETSVRIPFQHRGSASSLDGTERSLGLRNGKDVSEIEQPTSSEISLPANEVASCFNGSKETYCAISPVSSKAAHISGSDAVSIESRSSSENSSAGSIVFKDFPYEPTSFQCPNNTDKIASLKHTPLGNDILDLSSVKYFKHLPLYQKRKVTIINDSSRNETVMDSIFTSEESLDESASTLGSHEFPRTVKHSNPGKGMFSLSSTEYFNHSPQSCVYSKRKVTFISDSNGNEAELKNFQVSPKLTSEGSDDESASTLGSHEFEIPVKPSNPDKVKLPLNSTKHFNNSPLSDVHGKRKVTFISDSNRTETVMSPKFKSEGSHNESASTLDSREFTRTLKHTNPDTGRLPLSTTKYFNHFPQSNVHNKRKVTFICYSNKNGTEMSPERTRERSHDGSSACSSCLRSGELKQPSSVQETFPVKYIACFNNPPLSDVHDKRETAFIRESKPTMSPELTRERWQRSNLSRFAEHRNWCENSFCDKIQYDQYSDKSSSSLEDSEVLSEETHDESACRFCRELNQPNSATGAFPDEGCQKANASATFESFLPQTIKGATNSADIAFESSDSVYESLTVSPYIFVQGNIVLPHPDVHKVNSLEFVKKSTEFIMSSYTC